MRQSSTGVRGVSDMAMLSSLLNISDSVPPIHARSATTSHFFLRDLGDREQRASSVFQYLRAKNSIPAPLGTDSTDHPSILSLQRFLLSRSFSLNLAQILQGNPAILSPLHREVQLLHQPLAFICQPIPRGSVTAIIRM